MHSWCATHPEHFFSVEKQTGFFELIIPILEICILRRLQKQLFDEKASDRPEDTLHAHVAVKCLRIALVMLVKASLYTAWTLIAQREHLVAMGHHLRCTSWLLLASLTLCLLLDSVS